MSRGGVPQGGGGGLMHGKRRKKKCVIRATLALLPMPTRYESTRGGWWLRLRTYTDTHKRRVSHHRRPGCICMRLVVIVFLPATSSFTPRLAAVRIVHAAAAARIHGLRNVVSHTH